MIHVICSDEGAIETPVFGIDRTLSIGPVLDWLQQIDVDPGSKSIVESLQSSFASCPGSIDREGCSIARARNEIAELVAKWGSTTHDESQRRIGNAILTSAENVARFQTDDRVAATTEREELMKRQLREHVGSQNKRTNSSPRTLVKVGHQHARRSGLQGTTGPLGQTISEIAASRGLESFHISIQLVNRPGVNWSLTDYPEYEDLSALGDPEKWVLVDLRPVRSMIASPGSKVTDAMREMIEQFDAVVLLGGCPKGTTEWAGPLLSSK